MTYSSSGGPHLRSRHSNVGGKNPALPLVTLKRKVIECIGVTLVNIII